MVRPGAPHRRRRVQRRGPARLPTQAAVYRLALALVAATSPRPSARPGGPGCGSARRPPATAAPPLPGRPRRWTAGDLDDGTGATPVHRRVDRRRPRERRARLLDRPCPTCAWSGPPRRRPRARVGLVLASPTTSCAAPPTCTSVSASAPRAGDLDAAAEHLAAATASATPPGCPAPVPTAGRRRRRCRGPGDLAGPSACSPGGAALRHGHVAAGPPGDRGGGAGPASAGDLAGARRWVEAAGSGRTTSPRTSTSTSTSRWPRPARRRRDGAVGGPARPAPVAAPPRAPAGKPRRDRRGPRPRRRAGNAGRGHGDAGRGAGRGGALKARRRPHFTRSARPGPAAAGAVTATGGASAAFAARSSAPTDRQGCARPASAQGLVDPLSERGSRCCTCSVVIRRAGARPQAASRSTPSAPYTRNIYTARRDQPPGGRAPGRELGLLDLAAGRSPRDHHMW